MSRYDIIKGKKVPIKRDQPNLIMGVDIGSADSETVVALIAKLQKEQNENIEIVGISRGHTKRGFLHEHPGLQQRLNIGNDHVIVDRGDWERARQTLTGIDGTYTNLPPPSSPPLHRGRTVPDLSRYNLSSLNISNS